MKPYYSVIIPVYNSEKNIERCIDSVLAQSFIDFELILVDDGSSDNGGKICDKYAEMDKRIIVIHQKNQGVSSARNMGLERAQGQYIVFIDSDDFVEKDILLNLNQADADLVLVGFSDYFDQKVTNIILDDEDKWTINSEESISKFIKLKSSMFVWGKRYKKSIIQENNIIFRSDMKFNEDNIFNNEYILKSNTVINIKWAGYYHCQYVTDTLSSTAEKVPFTERTKWRKIAFEQFCKYPSIQKIYVSQMLYFAEKELVAIANKNTSLFKKYSEVKNIVEDEFFQKSMMILPYAFTKDVKMFCKYKMIVPLIFKYSKKLYVKCKSLLK